MKSCQAGKLLENLNHPEKRIRLEAIQNLTRKIKSGEIAKPLTGEDVNNHIHTFYSFSPYSPARAIWMSYMAGLTTSGIMDHESISGAEEFIEAGKIVGLATTIGVECRCDFSGTQLEGKMINNPDQRSLAYIAIHGIPHTRIQAVKDYFAPYLAERNRRNHLMVERINRIFSRHGVSLDFDRDVVPLSRSSELGSITERHLLFALSQKLADRFDRSPDLVSFLEEKLHLDLNQRVRGYLEDDENPHYLYDLLGALKSDLVEDFYIDATTECPHIRELIAFGSRIGVVIAYAYLGDVAKSVTGDKKSRKFEDDYLELLFETLKELNFHAVTYMPTRNTPAQLKRVQALCKKYSLFQISGVDINSPRQAFTYESLRRPEFRHLISATWALIGHELQATEDLEKGMFSQKVTAKYPDLKERIEIFEEIGKSQAVMPAGS